MERVYLPGEVEEETVLRRTKEGIPFTDAALKTLNDLAAEFGVEPFAWAVCFSIIRSKCR